jgi:hypothetical protein
LNNRWREDQFPQGSSGEAPIIKRQQMMQESGSATRHANDKHWLLDGNFAVARKQPVIQLQAEAVDSLQQYEQWPEQHHYQGAPQPRA